MHGKNKLLLSIAIIIVLWSINPSGAGNFSPEYTGNIAVTATYTAAGGQSNESGTAPVTIPHEAKTPVIPAGTAEMTTPGPTVKTPGFEAALGSIMLCAVCIFRRKRGYNK